MKLSDTQLAIIARFGGGGEQAMAAELIELRALIAGEPTQADRDARIRTLGGWVNPFAPQPGQLRIRDIARGLACMIRYKGQTRQLYTVAEHSVIVSTLVAPEYARQALLHDASEAMLGDMSAPVKRAPCMAPFRALEDRLQAAAYLAFGVHTTPEADAAVHAVDRRICADEILQLIDLDIVGQTRAEIVATYGEPYGTSIPCLTPRDAEYVFLARFAELFPEFAE